MTTIDDINETKGADELDGHPPLDRLARAREEQALLDAARHGHRPDPDAGRARWPVYGVLAGVNGLVSSFMILGSGISEEDAQLGVGVIEKLERGNFRVGAVLGMLSIGFLFVTVAAWRRWLEQVAPDDLAARTIPTALAGIPILNVFFVSMAATMVLYLPGGTDAGWLSDDALFVNFSMLDFGPLLGWWGAMVAAISLTVMAFGSNPAIPRWMGVFSIAMLLLPVGMFLAIGLPGLVGFFGPIWLVVISFAQLLGTASKA